jgi:hypothetical protein
LSLPGWARASHEANVRAKLSQLILANMNDKVVVFAHSYGSYLFAATLKENQQLRVARVIFFGSIVSANYDWDGVAHCLRVENARKPVPVLNCCGSRDYWPVVARFLNETYGDTGTRGFNNGRVIDRFYDGNHSRFLSPNFAADTWINFAVSGIEAGRDEATPLDHRAAVVFGHIFKFFWRTLGLRHVVAFVYCYWLCMLLVALIYGIGVLGYSHFFGEHCHDRSDVTLAAFIERLDRSLDSDPGFREFQTDLSRACWHVKWQARIKNGSNREEKNHFVVIEPIEPLNSLKSVDLDKLQIYCVLASGKDWNAFSIGDVVTIEGDTKQILRGQIMLKNCSVAKRSD